MRTVRTKVYTFAELTPSAQQTAISNYLNSEREYEWMDEYIDTIKQGLEFYGFELGNRWSIDYSSANCSHAPITSSHRTEVDELSGVRLWKYLQNNYSTYFCKYDKKHKPTLDGNCPFTGFCGDESFLDKVREFMMKPTNISFAELMESSVYDVLKQMECDYDDQNSEEYAIERLQEDGTEFTVNGNIF